MLRAVALGIVFAIGPVFAADSNDPYADLDRAVKSLVQKATHDELPTEMTPPPAVSPSVPPPAASPPPSAVVGSDPETILSVDCWGADMPNRGKLDLKFLPGGDLEARKRVDANLKDLIKGHWSVVSGGAPVTVSVTIPSFSATTYALDTATMRLTRVSGELPGVFVRRQPEKGMFSQ